MTSTLPAPAPARTARPRRYLMCRPDHFAVTYAINPWMDPTVPVDTALALHQWEQLRQTYVSLGHRVEVLDALPGLPDMVFAANGGTVVGGRAVTARFTHPQRQPEAAAYGAWLRAAGLSPATTDGRNEGEGDLLLVGEVLLAGSGFRTEVGAHAEVAAALGVEVVGLELVDPRYYHLDTALAVLDDAHVAYLPDAFSPRSQAVLAERFPDAVLARPEDAALLGLNAVSDGRHVVLAQGADALADALRDRGYVPVPVDLSELRKAGGGAKCCTLELRS